MIERGRFNWTRKGLAGPKDQTVTDHYESKSMADFLRQRAEKALRGEDPGQAVMFRPEQLQRLRDDLAGDLGTEPTDRQVEAHLVRSIRDTVGWEPSVRVNLTRLKDGSIIATVYGARIGEGREGGGPI